MSDMYAAEKQVRTVNEWLDVLVCEIGRLASTLEGDEGATVKGETVFQDRSTVSFDDLMTRAEIELEKAVTAIRAHREVLRILKARM